MKSPIKCEDNSQSERIRLASLPYFRRMQQSEHFFRLDLVASLDFELNAPKPDKEGFNGN